MMGDKERVRRVTRWYPALLLLLCVAALVAVGCEVPETTFTVRIQNISEESNIPTSFSPGVFAVHDQSFQLFFADEGDMGYGLEALAEDGDPDQLESYVRTAAGVFESGLFLSPFRDGNAGPLFPGEGAYEFSFTTDSSAQYLSFTTMFVQSNDLFFAPDASGLKLFRFGAPINGDVTRGIRLWDAYTEINEEPGQGAYQLPRQVSADSGPSETGPVSEVNDRFEYPPVQELIRVVVTSQ